MSGMSWDKLPDDLKAALVEAGHETTREQYKIAAAQEAETVAFLKEQGVEIGDEDVGRLHELHIEAGIAHVGGGQTCMETARFRADMLGPGGAEGDDVVLHLPLYDVDSVAVASSASTAGLCRPSADQASLEQRPVNEYVDLFDPRG